MLTRSKKRNHALDASQRAVLRPRAIQQDWSSIDESLFCYILDQVISYSGRCCIGLHRTHRDTALSRLRLLCVTRVGGGACMVQGRGPSALFGL